MRFIVFVTLGLLLAGCAGIQERNLLTAPVVSMTHSKLPPNYKLQSGRPFLTEFCEGDRPVVNTGKVIGLADQAILKAQKRYKATHLLDVRVVREGDCVIAEGTTAKAVRVEKRSERSRNAMLAPKLVSPQQEPQTTGRSPAGTISKDLNSNSDAIREVDEYLFTDDVLAPDSDAPAEIL